MAGRIEFAPKDCMDHATQHDLTVRLNRIKEELAKRVKMNACLSEENVREFEERWRIRLPEEYRGFLLTVGNGGLGPPHYGLLPLGTVPGDYDRSDQDVLQDLHKPFPLSKLWVWEGEKEERPDLLRAIDHGNLVLGTDGCGMYWILIICGVETGRIWLRTGEGITPCDPPRDFLSWYEYWLRGGRDWWAGAGVK